MKENSEFLGGQCHVIVLDTAGTTHARYGSNPDTDSSGREKKRKTKKKEKKINGWEKMAQNGLENTAM